MALELKAATRPSSCSDPLAVEESAEGWKDRDKKVPLQVDYAGSRGVCKYFRGEGRRA